MSSLHEKLVSGLSGKDAKAASSEKGASSQVVEIDAEGVEKMAQVLEKVPRSGAERELLAKAAWALRTLQAQKDYLVTELATRMHMDDAHKVAKDLVARGICEEKDVDLMTEKVAKLSHLGAMKEAVALVHTPKKELPIGTVEKSAATGGESKGGANDWLKRDPAAQFLMQSAGLA